MGLERRYSAERVAAIAMGSSLLTWLAVTATAFPDPLPNSPQGSHRELAYYLGLLLFAIAAGIVTFVFIAAFKRGVNDGIWSEASRQRLLAQLSRPVWTASVVVMALGAVGYVFYDLITYQYGVHPHHANGGLVYFWLSPLIAFGQLRAALKPPAPTRGGSSIWLGDVKPLRSDHWGQR
jgi:H+/Cl- antiporter ClcA